MNDISNQVMTCLILHNILVSGHVMEDINTRCDPYLSIFKDKKAEVKQNNDLIVDYNNNYCHAEGNYLTEHPDSVVTIIQKKK